MKERKNEWWTNRRRSEQIHVRMNTGKNEIKEIDIGTRNKGTY